MRFLLAAGFSFGILSSAYAQKKFVLELPNNPQASSTAVVTANGLQITDAAGRTTSYRRMQQLDPMGGRFHAYYSQAARQSLLWPANGMGNMQVRAGLVGKWRASQMIVRPARPPKAIPPPPLQPVQPAGPVVPSPRAFRAHPAATLIGNTAYTAFVDSTGALRLSFGTGQKWKHEIVKLPNVPPASPVVIVPQAGNSAVMFVVDRQGRVVRVAIGRTNVLRIQAGLTGGAQLSSIPGSNWLGAIDAQGRIVMLDPATGRLQIIEPRTGRFAPGGPLTFVDHSRFFAVDLAGTIVEYRTANAQFQGKRWTGPFVVSRGYVPGSAVAAVGLPRPPGTAGPERFAVAAIDRKGQLIVYGNHPKGWAGGLVSKTQHRPGTLPAMFNSGNQVTISTVAANGNWMLYRLIRPMQWAEETITRGLMPGSPVVSGSEAMLFAMAPREHLVMAERNYWAGWETWAILHGQAAPPAIEKTRIVQNRALGPATVFLANSSTEAMIVQVHDVTNAGVQEIKIPARSRVKATFNRDAGSVVRETHLIAGPFGFAESVNEFTIPPASLQTLVLYADRTIYEYIDRRPKKPKGALANFDLKSPVSLGVFHLPPGPALRDGMTIDLARGAQDARNPGAVRWFPRPRTR